MSGLVDSSGRALAPTNPAPAKQEAAPNPFAHRANPKAAEQLRGIADMVEQGAIFAFSFVGLGLDEKNPKPLSHIVEDPAHRSRMVAELEITKGLFVNAEVQSRYFPKPLLADGTPANPNGPGAAE